MRAYAAVYRGMREKPRQPSVAEADGHKRPPPGPLTVLTRLLARAAARAGISSFSSDAVVPRSNQAPEEGKENAKE
jgi:hypothetical protein